MSYGNVSMDLSELFSPDYITARRRFREAAAKLGWALEAHSIGATGRAGEELTVDIAISRQPETDKTLVLSSGLHGVEGLFGSAVQLGLLEQWRTGQRTLPAVRCVFLHGLNPFGFSWLRRCDENNVDPNRNFLLEGESYSGSPQGYANLDGLINPPSPPGRFDLFLFKALWTIAQQGMPAVRQAIAGGQYEFPRGLFFGGFEQSRVHLILRENLGRWLQGSRDVVHLDFHTGLGRNAAYKLLIDYPLSDNQQQRLTSWFGAGSFELCDSRGISYDARGGLGRWCVAHNFADDYLFACAEFGTFGPIRVLAALRTENRAHHWGQPDSAVTRRAKDRLQEVFCPSSKTWRSKVLDSSFDLVTRAIRGLTG